MQCCEIKDVVYVNFNVRIFTYLSNDKMSNRYKTPKLFKINCNHTHSIKQKIISSLHLVAGESPALKMKAFETFAPYMSII